jgi:ferredoxin--NADP+ reductase
MICGSPAMLDDCCKMLDARGFKISRTSARRATT